MFYSRSAGHGRSRPCFEWRRFVRSIAKYWSIMCLKVMKTQTYLIICDVLSSHIFVTHPKRTTGRMNRLECFLLPLWRRDATSSEFAHIFPLFNPTCLSFWWGFGYHITGWLGRVRLGQVNERWGCNIAIIVLVDSGSRWRTW